MLLSLALAGCSMLAAIDRGPRECGQVFDRARCLAIADVATSDIGKTRADVASIVIVPGPTPEGMTLGGPPPIRLAITLTDGSVHDARICGGLSLAPACTNDPRLAANSVLGAYTDVPCAGEAPDGCATPLPSFESTAEAAAAPLRIDGKTIAIDHAGRYELVLGDGSLPNGVLTEAAFEFGEAWPDDVALRDGEALLDVQSLEPDGRPFDNRYLHGWRPGVERVRAVLTFDVLWFAPGATLKIRNVVVR